MTLGVTVRLKLSLLKVGSGKVLLYKLLKSGLNECPMGTL